MRIITVALFLVPLSAQAAPGWINQTERQVLGGDIVHVGAGNGPTSQYAQFIARETAIKSIIEECGGFASKEIVPWSSYVEESATGFKAWAQVSIPFDACEFGKRPVSEVERKKWENPKIVEAQALYDRLLTAPQDEYLKSQISKFLDDQKKEFSRFQDDQRSDVQDLRNQLNSLQAQVNQIHQPLEPVKLPAVDSMKVYCRNQYQHAMFQLQQAAGAGNGNMADPALVGQYNNAMFQGRLCERMQ